MEKNTTLLTNILSGLEVGVLCLDDKGWVTYVNPKANAILKASHEALVNKRWSSLPYNWINEKGETLPDSDVPFSVVLETGKAITNIIVGAKAFSSTQTIWLKLNLTPVFSESGSITNVTITFDEVAHNIALPYKMESSEVEGIVQLLPDIILKVNHLNQFIYCHSNNPEELLFPIDTFLGKPIHEVFSGDLLNLLEDKINEVRNTGEIVVFEYELVIIEGKNFWFEARLMLSNNKVMLIIRNITEQKLVKLQLQLEKQLLETTIKSLPGVFYLSNKEGKIIKWNENFENITGYSSLEIQQLNPLDFFDDDEKGLLAQKIGNVYESGEDSVEANFKLKDGSKIPFYFTGVAFEYKGEMCLLGVGIDISNQKRAESNQRESESRFRGLVENSSSGMAIISSEMKIKYISPTLGRILGYSEDEFAKIDSKLTLFHPDDYPIVLKHFNEVLSQKENSTTTFVSRIKDRSGTWRRIESILTNMLDNPAINGIVSNFRDVTEKVDAEQRLQKALQELQTHLNNTPLGIVEYNPDLIIKGWSKKCEDIFGWTADEVLGQSLSAFDFVYDEDIDKTKKIAAELLSSTVDGNISSNRNFTKHGNVIDCVWYNSIIKDEEGKVLNIMSMVEDITDIKNAEQKVFENERRLTHLISNLPGIVYRCRNDRNWTMVYLSESCINLLGYHSDELINNEAISFASLIHEEDREYVWKEVQEALKQNRKYELNYRIIRKNGEIRWFKEKGGAVPRLSKDELILEGFIQDVTKEHIAQSALEKRDKEKSFLLSEIHHRVKNNLAIVSGLMQLQALGSKDEKIETVLLDSVGRIKSIALIHEHLYTSDDFSRIRFDENIKKLVQNISSVMRSDKNIVTLYNLEPVELDINQAVPCALLINEIVTNTYKHAFYLRDSGEIQISSSEVNGDVTLIIKDNGVGINKKQVGNQESTSLGMKLIEVVTHQLGGKLTIDGSKGTTITIEFKKQEIAN